MKWSNKIIDFRVNGHYFCLYRESEKNRGSEKKYVKNYVDGKKTFMELHH